MITKVCKACACEKPVSEYYRHGCMTDGRLNQCRECVCLRMKAYRVANLDKVRRQGRDRTRNLTPSQRNARNKVSLDRLRKNPVSRREYNKRWRERNPEKVRAHRVVGGAVKSGKLETAGCTSCGSRTNVQAHHEDYSKPLAITWLCSMCHSERHREIKDKDLL